jgi:hypothetical protein
MRSAILGLAVGLAIGVSATVYFHASRLPAGRLERAVNSTGEPVSSATTNRQEDGPAIGGNPSSLDTAERAAAYALATTSDFLTLVDLLEEATGLPDPAHREFALGVLLSRVAEVDPARFVSRAERLGLTSADLVPLFVSWAGRDLNGALEELSAISNARDAREIALRMLEVIGPDDRNTEIIAAALVPFEQDRFRLRAIALEAERDPSTALDRALALDTNSARTAAVRAVATAWSRQSIAAALLETQRIDDEAMKRIFTGELLQDIAPSDVDAVFTYLERVAGSPDTRIQQQGLIQPAIMQIARQDPARALEFADRLPNNFARLVRQTALMQWAETDPVAALNYADTLPPAIDTQNLRSIAARVYGERNPDAAIAWLASLGAEGGPVLQSAVFSGVARTDPQRAVDYLLDGNRIRSRATDPQEFTLIANLANADGVDLRGIGDRIMSAPDSGLRSSTLQMFVQTWARRDPTGALSWALERGSSMRPNLIASLAANFAAVDPQSAAAMTGQIPQSLRDTWIVAVAQSYSQTDSVGALRWLEQFRGTSAYQAGAAAMASSLAHFDPPAAAELLGTLEGNSDAMINTATQLALQWSTSDPVAASAWVRNLPRGALRDRALVGIASTTAENILDQNSLALFSTAQARGEAINVAISSVAQTDPARARTLMDQHVDDPRQREALERAIERQQDGRIMISPGNVAINPFFGPVRIR